MNLRQVRTALAIVLGCSVLAAVPASGETDAQGFVRMDPENVPWKPLPGYEGVQFAVIDGDPAKPGIYVIRIKFPPGVMSRPHYHPEDRHAVVLKGTWYTGTGDKFDPASTVGLKPGSYMKHPAGGHHFDGAKDEEVILQLIGTGPSNTVLLHPEDGHIGRSLQR